MRFSLSSIKCSARLRSLRLLPSNVSLCELCTTIWLTRWAVVGSWEKPPNIWLTVAENAFVGWALNFRVRMLLKGAVNHSNFWNYFMFVEIPCNEQFTAKVHEWKFYAMERFSWKHLNILLTRSIMAETVWNEQRKAKAEERFRDEGFLGVLRYQTRDTAFHRDIQRSRKKLKIRRAAENSWRNSRCLGSCWNTVCLLNRNKKSKE